MGFFGGELITKCFCPSATPSLQLSEYRPDSSDKSNLEADPQSESEKVSRSPNTDFLPGKIRFSFEADGSENAAVPMSLSCRRY